MSVAGAVVRGAGRLAPALGFRGAGRLGAGLGMLAWAIDARHRRVALDNLRTAFPDWSEARRRGLVRAVFRQVGRTAFEILWSSRLDEDTAPATGPLEGSSELAAALEEGRGALLTSAHFGNWELLAMRLGLAGFRLNVITRRLEDPELEALLAGLRTRTGNRVIHKDEAVRESLKALDRGEVVAIVVDQNTLRSQATFVPFFGRPAATTRLLARLHLRTGAPVVPTFAMPREGGGYRFLVEAPLPAVERDDPDGVHRVTTLITRRIEERVRECPEAWLWIHDRWRTRPE